MLEEEGYEVATALNGFDALIKIGNAGPPDLILLDLTMPVLDGTQFLSNLRDRGLLPKVPVIVVSAVAFRPAPGATSIVTKPIDFDGLLALVREHCHDGQLARVH
jgi:CheY-like chemotaxis protein